MAAPGEGPPRVESPRSTLPGAGPGRGVTDRILLCPSAKPVWRYAFGFKALKSTAKRAYFNDSAHPTMLLRP